MPDQELLARAKSMHWTDPVLIAYLSEPSPRPNTVQRQPLVDGQGEVIGTAVVTRHKQFNQTMRVHAVIEGRRFHGTTPTFSGTYVRLRPFRNQEKS